MPSKSFVQVAPKAERAGVQPIDVSWLAEHDKVHVNALFKNVDEMEHEEQVIPVGLAYANQAAVSCQLLEFT